MNTRKIKVCPHCRDIVNVLRGCGGLAGAEAEHYLLAAAVGAQNVGYTLEESIEVLRMVWRDEATERAHFGVDLGTQDVSVIVEVVPTNAIDAFVAAQGERPA